MNYCDRPLIVTDLETTGLDAIQQDIIEIGAIRLHPQTLEETGRLEVKVRIEHPDTVQSQALLVNGYTEELWKDAVPLTDAMTMYSHLAVEGILVAYNITFEFSFLHEAFRRCGSNIDKVLDYHRIDVPSIVWFQKPNREKMSLNVVCREFGIEPEPVVHRAINGAETTVKLLRKIRGM
jgi:DNA polymerase-3 subunit epsilon